MSKKYKNKHCVYCSVAKSDTGDHIFAREFFLINKRDNLPKVPSCLNCNQKKSQLEHELTTVLPFGGRHSDALENLREYVPARLNKNIPLLNSIRKSNTTIWVSNSRIIEPLGAIDINHEKLCDLFNYITKALVFYHFNILINDSASVESTIEIDLSHHFANNNKNIINKNLGNGTIIYRGAQSIENDYATVWEYTFYGGLLITDSFQNIFSITLPKGTI